MKADPHDADGVQRQDDMKLRVAKQKEFSQVRDFYWNLIERMTGNQNTIGWKKGIELNRCATALAGHRAAI